MGKDAPKCAFSGCSNPPKPGKKYCASHERAGAELEKKAAKAKAEQEEKARKQKELEAKKVEQANLQKKNEEAAKLKKEKVKKIAQSWQGEINAIVSEVKHLRQTNPGANAGRNPNGTTKGGTDNPLELKLPSDAKNIDKKDVFDVMNPDSSDSGLIKFRIKDGATNILVHVK